MGVQEVHVVILAAYPVVLPQALLQGVVDALVVPRIPVLREGARGEAVDGRRALGELARLIAVRGSGGPLCGEWAGDGSVAATLTCM